MPQGVEHDLNRRESKVVAALASGSTPWLPASAVSKAARIRARRVLERLVAKGLVECWRGDGNGYTFKTERYTFTPYGAYLLDYRLDEERDGEARWFAGLGAELDAPLVARRWGACPIRFPERIADPRKGPLQYLLDLESGESTTDPGRAAQLWNRPIVRDPRLGRARRR